MNQQLIDRLLHKAGAHFGGNGINYSGFEPSKFAQLIVRECALIADTERSNSVGCGYITKTNGMRIKEHFGVET